MRIRDWSSDVCSSDLLDRADVADWQRRLYAKGWVAPNWPKAFGGTGWTAIQKYIFDVECGVANAPEISLIALSMVGPVLCRFGSTALQQRFLDPILRGDLWFRSEEHTLNSSLMRIPYAVFRLKKQNETHHNTHHCQQPQSILV